MKPHPFRPALLLAMIALLGTSVEADTLRVPILFATIQGAIDSAAPGDTILVAAGTYRERLVLKAGIRVLSEGDDTKGTTGLKRAEATILNGTGGEGAGVAMAAGATLDGFTVTGVGQYDNALWLHHFGTQGNQQSHQSIGQPGVPGIAVTGDCAVQHNIVHHIGYTGIAVTGKGSAHITENVCFRNMGGGIGAMSGATPVIERNSCYENFYAGIGCSASSPIVKGNDCHGNIRAGIGISEGSAPTVTGNHCYKNRRAGIGIRGKDTQPTIEANDCSKNDLAGIGVEEEARPSIVQNRIVGNKLVAIGITGGSEATIKDNELTRDGGVPPMIAVLDTSRALITGNTIRGGGVAGILVKGHAEIRGNLFLGNGPVAGANQAIWAQDGSDVTCTGNRVQAWKKVLTYTSTAKVTDEANELIPAP